MTSDRRDSLVIVCALEFERLALQQAGVARWARLERSGPGATGIERWWHTNQPRGTVVLAGLAGALHEHAAPGTAWWASEVVTETRHGEMGNRIAPPISFDPPARILSAATVVGDPSSRREARGKSGADLVDLESARFASLAAGSGVPWAIVRGVSDGVAACLPRGIESWVDADGRARPWRAMRSLIAQPSRLFTVIGLHRDGRRAMAAVARLIESRFGPHASATKL